MKHTKSKKVSRRDFLKLSKNAALGAGALGITSKFFWVDEGLAAMEVSEGYLLVDVKKCQGCQTCMLSCSLVHEGVINPVFSRIQVIQDSFEYFPDDTTIEQCRQCVQAPCVENCPTKALKPDPNFGYVRLVDKSICDGCGICVESCPYVPSRPIVAADKNFNGEKKAFKCDLCAHAAYHWDEKGGGPAGKQACVETCPVKAIKFSKEVPKQEGDSGYKVNLRTRAWRKLGYPRG